MQSHKFPPDGKKQPLKLHRKNKIGTAASVDGSQKSDKTSNKVMQSAMQSFIRIGKATSRTIQHRSDPNGNIINLSKHSFTKEGQYDLLNRNLNFCPTPAQYNKSTLKKDLESFNRKIKLKAFFRNKKIQKQETELANKEPNIKSKTSWDPKKNHQAVETFIKAIKSLWKDFQIKINYLKII